MTRKYTATLLDYAEQAVREGQTYVQLARALGCSAHRLRDALAERGVHSLHGATSKVARAEGHVVEERYAAGESVLALAKSYGCARNVIADILAQRGVVLRDSSRASRIRMGALTRDERIALSARARAKRMDNLSANGKANVIAAAIGRGEAELAALLPGCERQHLLGRYAIDILWRNVAVEVKHRSGGAYATLRAGGGDEEISKSYTLCLFVINSVHVFRFARDEIVTLLDFVSRQPTTPGQYWVVRCAFDNAVPLDADDAYFAGMPIPPQVTTAISKRHLC